MSVETAVLNGRSVLLFEAGYPPKFKGIRVRNSTVTHHTGPQQTITRQEVSVQGMCLRHQTLQWQQSLTIEQRDAHAGWHAHIAWEHPCDTAVIGSGNWKLNIGEFGAMLTNAWRTHWTLTGQGESTTLELMGSKEWMEELGMEWRDPIPLGFPLLMGRPFRTLSPQMKSWVEDILFNDFTGAFQTAYQAELLQQLLLALMGEANKDHVDQAELTPADREAVEQAAQFIRDHTETHFSIVQIARQVTMNDCRLKKIFQQVMRMGMHEYLIDLRLNTIRQELLHTKKPMKALYEQAGYASTQGFITGFRRHFGCAPGELRR